MRNMCHFIAELPALTFAANSYFEKLHQQAAIFHTYSA